jgi:hypothetical protein
MTSDYAEFRKTLVESGTLQPSNTYETVDEKYAKVLVATEKLETKLAKTNDDIDFMNRKHKEIGLLYEELKVFRVAFDIIGSTHLRLRSPSLSEKFLNS